MKSEKYRIFVIEPNNHNLAYTTFNVEVNRQNERNDRNSIELRNKKRNWTPSPSEEKDWKQQIFETLCTSKSKSLSQRNLPFCLMILAFSILLSFPTILIPQHDGIKSPEYWYELMINVNLTFNLSWILAVIYDGKNILKINSITTIGSCMRLYAASALSFDAIYYLSHLIWTRGFGYNYPIPFANIAVYLSSLIFLITLWYEFPEQLRRDKEKRKRVFAYILSYLWYAIVGLQKNGLRMMFVKVPLNLQWCMAIVLPVYRKFNMLVMNKIVARWVCGTSNKDLLVAKSYVNIYINCNYALFIAISIGSIASLTTSYSILTVEFIINLKNCWKIINLSRRKGKNHVLNEKIRETQEETIVMLALTEILEILVPLAYTLTFVLAYYGPNSDILGNIRNDYWQYHAVDNPTKILSTIFKMFCFDTASAIIGGILLWQFSEINLWKEFNKVLSAFWPLIALRIAQITSKYYNNLLINFGWDSTFQFDWISNEVANTSTTIERECDYN